MSAASLSVINRGKRVITLRPHPDGTKRVLEPGKSIECLDEKEFKFLTGYHDIGDVNLIAPQLAKREEALRKQLGEATAENERLRAQQAQAASPPPASVLEDDESKKHDPEEPAPAHKAAAPAKKAAKKKGR